MKKICLSTYVTPELYERTKRCSDKESVELAKIVRKALIQYLDRNLGREKIEK